MIFEEGSAEEEEEEGIKRHKKNKSPVPKRHPTRFVSTFSLLPCLKKSRKMQSATQSFFGFRTLN
jgi:hypothetical protein